MTRDMLHRKLQALQGNPHFDAVMFLVDRALEANTSKLVGAPSTDEMLRYQGAARVLDKLKKDLSTQPHP